MWIRTRVLVLFTLLAMCTPWPAWASGGGGSNGGLLAVVVLVGVVGAAYLLTHSVVEWAQRAFLVATSIEYLVLGVLLGVILFPGHTTGHVLDTLRGYPMLGWIPETSTLGSIEQLAPFIALAAGWIGLIYGMALDVPSLINRRDGALRLALVEGLLVSLPVATVAYGLLEVFAPADLALQEAARLLFELDDRPKEKELRRMAEAWSPWRGVAARALWAYYHVAKEREGIR